MTSMIINENSVATYSLLLSILQLNVNKKKHFSLLLPKTNFEIYEPC